MTTFQKLAAVFCAWGLIAGQAALAREAAKTQPDSAPAVTSKAQATAVPTFHCLGVYWSPENGQAGKNVLVKFRAVGERTWHDGLPMRYNPVDTPECKGDYRGSLVNLKPGTNYEIAL